MSTRQVVLTRKAAMTLGALHGFLKPRLAQDAKLDLTGILARVTSKNFATQKPVILKGLTRALDGKLAKDASVEGLTSLLDALEAEKAMDDPLPMETDPNAGPPIASKGKRMDKSMDDEPEPEEMVDTGAGPDNGIHEQIKAFLQDKLSPEDLAAVEQMIAGESADEELPDPKAKALEGLDEEMDDEAEDCAEDEPPPFKGKPEVGGGMSKDSVNKTVQAALAAERTRQGAARDAERFVRPWVGELAIANDSAEGVFKTALNALGVDTKDMHPSAYKAVLQAQPLPDNKKPAVIAADEASTTDFAKRFPGAARIKFA